MPPLPQANQADLKGEGKLEMEGVRPQRYAAGMHPFGAPDTAGEPYRLRPLACH